MKQNLAWFFGFTIVVLIGVSYPWIQHQMDPTKNAHLFPKCKKVENLDLNNIKIKNLKTVAILGATGYTGIELVKHALASGLKTIAFTRNKESELNKISNPNLIIRNGDLLEYSDV